ncbi:MAG: DUF4912 domain-containing protein [Candidatus Sumerlaeota bacterium]|nr:DUF4912 domain-containing protein [Candidatus Sumerlaeota bacterium]
MVSKPMALAAPAKPATSAAAAKPTTLAAPAKPATIAAAAKPTILAIPAKPATIAAAVRPTTLATSAKPTTLAAAVKPMNLAAPAKPVIPAAAAKPAIPAAAAKQPTPASPAKPATLAAPAKTAVAAVVGAKPAAAMTATAPTPVASAKVTAMPAPKPEAVSAPVLKPASAAAAAVEAAPKPAKKAARKTPEKTAAAAKAAAPKVPGRRKKAVAEGGAELKTPEAALTAKGMVFEPSSTTSGASDNLVMQARSHQFELEQRGVHAPYREPLPAAVRELPERYNETKLLLLPRDPDWVFAYWEVAYHDRQNFKATDDNMRLRLYDVTDVEFTGSNAHSFVDIAIGSSSNWYLRLPASDRHWVADLGVVAPDGTFRTIIRSNTIMPPRNSVSPFVAEEEEWMTIQSDFERIFELSGGRVARGGAGGSQEARAMQRQQFEIPRLSMGSEALASGALMKRGEFAGPSEGRGFRLVVNTELIVYGATEPDATVSIQGHPVRLNPDGTFRLRIALNDGALEIPVKATRADGEESREITPIVTRETR